MQPLWHEGDIRLIHGSNYTWSEHIKSNYDSQAVKVVIYMLLRKRRKIYDVLSYLSKSIYIPIQVGPSPD